MKYQDIQLIQTILPKLPKYLMKVGVLTNAEKYNAIKKHFECMCRAIGETPHLLSSISKIFAVGRLAEL